MTEKVRVHSVASRAFAQFQAEGAEEFGTIAALGERLKGLRAIQADHQTTVWDALPRIEETGDNQWRMILEGIGTPAKRGEGFRFRESAFDQFCSTIGFPSDTLTKCPTDLAKQNLAHFSMLHCSDKLLVRTEGEEVRAVLSGNYKELDHIEIVSAFLASKFDYEVNYAGLTPKKMFLLAIEPESKFEGPDGSEMSHGTYVGNSETGDGSFFACDFFYDYICGNRNIWGFKVRGGEYRRIHRGDVREGLKLLMEWLGSDRQKQIAKARELFGKAAAVQWGRDDDKVVEFLMGKGIQKGIAHQALMVAQERWPGEEYTAFRVYSGVTKAAQSYAPDKRFLIEQAAGELLAV